MNKQPNIFDYATSELSQDAYFAWLAAWADERYAAVNAPMHAIGRRFVAWLFEHAGQPAPPYAGIEVHLQKERADLLFRLHGPAMADHYLLIEDKTYTTDHEEQINGYLSALRRSLGDAPITPIYIKTWVEARKKDDHKRIYLPDIVALIDQLDVDGSGSEILRSWCEVMKERYRDLLSYKERPMLQWKNEHWTGCFHELTSKPSIAVLEPGFGTVSNAAGGFMGCWLGWQEQKDKYYVYIQVDAYPGYLPQLGFRLGAGDDGKVDLDLARRFNSTLTELGRARGLVIERPKRLRSGKSSCFAILGGEVFGSAASGYYDERVAEQQLVKGAALLKACFDDLNAP